MSYQDGDRIFHAGFGLGMYYADGNTKIPPLQVQVEKGIRENISVGGILGYASSSNPYNDTDLNVNTGQIIRRSASLDYSYLLIGARGNYHFETSQKFDPYAGVTMGYVNVSLKNKGGFDDSSPLDVAASGLLYGAQIGANYYLTNKIGCWAELGYGVGYLNFGITYKF